MPPPSASRPPSSSSSSSSPPVPAPLLSAHPGSVHFGGFQLGQSLTQRVLIRNNSRKSVRLQFTLPTQGPFRASFANERKPFVSPGLTEELVVSFRAAAFQYYYDCLQVRCEEVAYGSSAPVALAGRLLVPLHAYPVVNSVDFPPRVDFGTVPLGQVARRELALSCSVPVEFEFALELTRPHPSFTVFPLSGVIPANGSTAIEIEFRPTVFATARAELELAVSQLGFAPMTCTLSGSSSSDAGVATPRSPTRVRTSGGNSATSSSPKRANTPSSPKRSPKRTGGARKPEAATDAAEYVDGIEIPRDLSSPSSVAFVLNQQAGKLRPKDLKRAIASNRELQTRQEEAALSAGGSHSGEDDDPLAFEALVRDEERFLERVQTDKQVQALLFEREAAESERREKSLEFQTHRKRVGAALLSPEQLKALRKLREFNALVLARQRREKQRNSFDTVAEEPVPLSAGFVPRVTPDFKEHKNDLWARRARVVKRFERAVSTCIIRQRAQKRLERLRSWLGEAPTRESVRARVEDDWRVGRAGSRAETASAPHDQPQELYLSSFPVVDRRAKASNDRQPVPATTRDLPPKLYSHLKFLPLKERDEALASGHTAFPLPPLRTYVPLERDRQLRVGALDELGCQLQLALSPPPVPALADHPSAKLSPLELLPRDVFLRAQAAVRPLVTLATDRETAAGYALRPQRVTRDPPRQFGVQREQQVGLGSLAALRTGGLFVSDVYVAKTTPGLPSSLLWRPGEQAPLFTDAWGVCGIPSVAKRQEDVPPLSDSESDTDDSGQASGPTWQDALAMFEEPAASDDDQEDCESEEKLGRAAGVHAFERFRHQLRQQRIVSERRREQLDKLPKVRVCAEQKVLRVILTEVQWLRCCARWRTGSKTRRTRWPSRATETSVRCMSSTLTASKYERRTR